MLIQPCPACGKATARLLDECSKLACVNYYRCEACGHTWNTDKATGAILHHVTPLTQTPHGQSALSESRTTRH